MTTPVIYRKPGVATIKIKKGTTWSLSITYKVKSTGTGIAITDARLKVRPRSSSTAVLLSLTVGNGITLGGSDGSLTLALSATETAALDFTAGVYDLEVVAAGSTNCILEGAFQVVAEVTY